MTLGNTIKELRANKKMSQQELANVLGMKRENVSNYERGVVTKIPSDILSKLADYFDVTTDYLLDRDEHLTLDGKPVNVEELVEASMQFDGKPLSEHDKLVAKQLIETYLKSKM